MTENSRKTDHLQGVTLENLLNQLVDEMGWETLAGFIRINCFRSNPSIRSSLTFLRRTPWARAQVEALFCGFKEGESQAQLKRRLQSLNADKPKPQNKPLQQKSSGGADPWNKARQKNQQQ